MAVLDIPETVAQTLDGVSIESVLDVGTGSGIFAEAFAERGLRVIGIDIREDMLAAAREHVPDGTFMLGQMEALPQDDNAVDLVFMGHVLHEADDLRVALDEARRVARKRVAALEWVHQEEDYGPPLWHRLEPETVEAAATAAGYAGVVTITLPHMVLYRFDL